MAVNDVKLFYLYVICSSIKNLSGCILSAKTVISHYSGGYSAGITVSSELFLSYNIFNNYFPKEKWILLNVEYYWLFDNIHWA